MPNTISKIQKRDGRIVPFDSSKIEYAIYRALFASGIKSQSKARKVCNIAVKILEDKFGDGIPTIEDAQDAAIAALKAAGYEKIARDYQTYREKKAEIRKMKYDFGIDVFKISTNALTVLERRYLLKDRSGNVFETPLDLIRRVSRAISQVEVRYGNKPEVYEKNFFDVMSKLEFLPNSPTLMNAGTELGMLSGCFVLPVEDNLKSIMEGAMNLALIQKAGGGTGFSFSRLRPENALIKSTGGTSSGPLTFMDMYNGVTETIKSGGKRRGANMGVLRIDHPDILKFILCKKKSGRLTNFNISVAVTDKFMDAVYRNNEYELINPVDKTIVTKLPARDVWNLLIKNAWESGDPGIIFIDEMNRNNPTIKIAEIESTNPCGEQPLLPYESCNLGSINLTRLMIEENGKYRFNWVRYREVIQTAVRFLDNVIDCNRFPVKEIEEMTKANRKIGLGLMGFADCLFMLGVKYDSNRALKFGEKLMKTLTDTAREYSEELGKEKGNFPNFGKSELVDKYKYMRNATVTTIAPTGTIGIIAGCSSGIEPVFAISFMRNVMDDTKMLEINPIFEKLSKQHNFYNGEIVGKIAESGSVKDIKEIPKNWRNIFVSSLDIKPEWHVKMQAAFQKYTDNGVSKTVNLPNEAAIDDVKRVYELAHKLKCKGITVFRYGCKGTQVLSIPTKKNKKVEVGSEYTGSCPTGLCQL